jgi:hypothetical protein
MDISDANVTNGIITIYREEAFGDSMEGGDHAIKALIMLQLPLRLKIDPKARFQVLNDDTAGKDLFGRPLDEDGNLKETYGNFFENINLREVKVSVDFERNFLQGVAAMLYIYNATGDDAEDNKRLLFEKGLSLDSGGNKLEISLTKAKIDMIRNTPIMPDVWIEFPTIKSPVTLAVPRNCAPLRVSFSAKGDYTQKIEF